jgi:lambda repressor-like predicted transcriptional regulator
MTFSIPTEDKNKFFDFLMTNEFVDNCLFDFDKYYKNKEHLYERLGGFSYRKPIYISKGDDSDYSIDVLKKFLKETSFHSELITAKLREITPTQFINNRYNNMKLTKYIQKIADNYATGAHIVNLYSKYLMDLKPIEGELVLSIHPIDYITMSESGYNWRTCQSISGDFAAGPLALLSDKSTMVAYLSSEKEMDLDIGGTRSMWWGKKWRVLVHTNPTYDRFVLSKHYPYNSPALEAELVKLINDVWPEKTFIEHRNLPKYLEETDQKMHYFAGNVANKIFYSDLSAQSSILSTTSLERNDDLKIRIGTSVKCLSCGCSDISDPSTFRCEDCQVDDMCECCGCGEAIFTEHAFYSEGEIFCEECAPTDDEEG